MAIVNAPVLYPEMTESRHALNDFQDVIVTRVYVSPTLFLKFISACGGLATRHMRTQNTWTAATIDFHFHQTG